LDTDLLSCYIGKDSINDFGEEIKMRQMKKKILMIFAVLLIFVCQVSAKTFDILNVDVVPSQPLDTDLITFNISGWAAHAPSFVDYEVYSPNGTSLRLDLYLDVWGLDAESNWTYSKQIQPLVQGIYSLEVNAFDNWTGNPWYGTLQDTYTVNFTVVPEPATIALFSLGLPFSAFFAKRKI